MDSAERPMISNSSYNRVDAYGEVPVAEDPMAAAAARVTGPCAEMDLLLESYTGAWRTGLTDPAHPLAPTEPPVGLPCDGPPLSLQTQTGKDVGSYWDGCKSPTALEDNHRTHRQVGVGVSDRYISSPERQAEQGEHPGAWPLAALEVMRQAGAQPVGSRQRWELLTGALRVLAWKREGEWRWPDERDVEAKEGVQLVPLSAALLRPLLRPVHHLAQLLEAQLLWRDVLELELQPLRGLLLGLELPTMHVGEASQLPLVPNPMEARRISRVDLAPKQYPLGSSLSVRNHSTSRSEGESACGNPGGSRTDKDCPSSSPEELRGGSQPLFVLEQLCPQGFDLGLTGDETALWEQPHDQEQQREETAGRDFGRGRRGGQLTASGLGAEEAWSQGSGRQSSAQGGDAGSSRGGSSGVEDLALETLARRLGTVPVRELLGAAARLDLHAACVRYLRMLQKLLRRLQHGGQDQKQQQLQEVHSERRRVQQDSGGGLQHSAEVQVAAKGEQPAKRQRGWTAQGEPPVPPLSPPPLDEEEDWQDCRETKRQRSSEMQQLAGQAEACVINLLGLLYQPSTDWPTVQRLQQHLPPPPATPAPGCLEDSSKPLRREERRAQRRWLFSPEGVALKSLSPTPSPHRPTVYTDVTAQHPAMPPPPPLFQGAVKPPLLPSLPSLLRQNLPEGSPLTQHTASVVHTAKVPTQQLKPLSISLLHAGSPPHPPNPLIPPDVQEASCKAIPAAGAGAGTVAVGETATDINAMSTAPFLSGGTWRPCPLPFASPDGRPQGIVGSCQRGEPEAEDRPPETDEPPPLPPPPQPQPPRSICTDVEEGEIAPQACALPRPLYETPVGLGLTGTAPTGVPPPQVTDVLAPAPTPYDSSARSLIIERCKGTASEQQSHATHGQVLSPDQRNGSDPDQQQHCNRSCRSPQKLVSIGAPCGKRQAVIEAGQKPQQQRLDMPHNRSPQGRAQQPEAPQGQQQQSAVELPPSPPPLPKRREHELEGALEHEGSLCGSEGEPHPVSHPKKATDLPLDSSDDILQQYECKLYAFLESQDGGVALSVIAQRCRMPPAIMAKWRPYAFLRTRPHIYTEQFSLTMTPIFSANPQWKREQQKREQQKREQQKREQQKREREQEQQQKQQQKQRGWEQREQLQQKRGSEQEQREQQKRERRKQQGEQQQREQREQEQQPTKLHGGGQDVGSSSQPKHAQKPKPRTAAPRSPPSRRGASPPDHLAAAAIRSRSPSPAYRRPHAPSSHGLRLRRSPSNSPPRRSAGPHGRAVQLPPPHADGSPGHIRAARRSGRPGSNRFSPSPTDWWTDPLLSSGRLHSRDTSLRAIQELSAGDPGTRPRPGRELRSRSRSRSRSPLLHTVSAGSRWPHLHRGRTPPPYSPHRRSSSRSPTDYGRSSRPPYRRSCSPPGGPYGWPPSPGLRAGYGEEGGSPRHGSCWDLPIWAFHGCGDWHPVGPTVVSMVEHHERALYELLSQPQYHGGLRLCEIRVRHPLPPEVMGPSGPYAFFRKRRHLFQELDGEVFTANPAARMMMHW